MVLEIAMRVHEDLVADDPDCNNAAYRHQAYRCYILLATWSLGTRQQTSYTVLCRMGNKHKGYVARTYWNLQRICARWRRTLK